MAIREISGDLLTCGADLICQQVNCMGVMGAGLAKQIREARPRVYTRYTQVCKDSNPASLMGKVLVVDGVANLFAQFGYGRDKQHTNYVALTTCFKRLRNYCIERDLTSIGIPYGIGCGLGGGAWGTVHEIIDTVFCEANLDIQIIKR